MRTCRSIYGEKTGLFIIDSIPHCLSVATKPHFLVLLVLTYSLTTRTVWDNIDDRYSSFALLSNVATFLGFACFDIFSCH